MILYIAACYHENYLNSVFKVKEFKWSTRRSRASTFHHHRHYRPQEKHNRLSQTFNLLENFTAPVEKYERKNKEPERPTITFTPKSLTKNHPYESKKSKEKSEEFEDLIRTLRKEESGDDLVMIRQTQKPKICENPNEFYHGKYLKKLLTAWNSFTENFHIEYFLSAGSLFGAFLHGDTIGCDSDLDVLIDKKDMHILEKYSEAKLTEVIFKHDNTFRLILQRDWRIDELGKRRRFRCDGKRTQHYEDSCSFQDAVGRLIFNRHHIDIFAYRTANGNVINLIDNKTAKIEEIFPLQQCRFLGVNTMCPRRVKYFLKLHYGYKYFHKVLRKQYNKRKDYIKHN